MLSPRLKALLALAVAMLLVGSSVAVGRMLATTLPIHLTSMARFALATVVLVPLVIRLEGRFPLVRRRTLIVLIAQALCGSFLFTVCLLSGLRLTGAAAAGVMAATTPAAVALMGWMFFREQLSGKTAIGIAVTVAGLVILHAGTDSSTAGSSPIGGTILILCAVGFEAIFLLLRRAIHEPLSPLAAAMWVSLLGFGFFLLPGLYEAVSLDPAQLTPMAAAEVAYYGLAVTAAAYILWFYGVMRVDAATAGVMTGIMPVAALGCAALWCGEQVGWRELAGCAGVLAGIGVLARPRKKLSAQTRNVVVPGLRRL